MDITSDQVRAARTLLRLPQTELARRAGRTEVERDATLSGRAPAKATAGRRRAGSKWAAHRTSPVQQQKGARRRRAERAILKELAKIYNVGVATTSRLL